MEERSSVISTDDTTLFICSGMQSLKSRFRLPDGSVDGSIQRCIRTNDLDLVGDGSHLTSFEMVGNFSFGRSDYERSVELWHRVVQRLQIPITHVTTHPTRDDHRRLWANRGYVVTLDPECVWSDGDIGGHSSELYVGAIEVGNLVNIQGGSTDVGFGVERLLQVIEGVPRVDESSLFVRDWHPIVRDHARTVAWLWDEGIGPGTRGREYVCRRLVRRMLPHLGGSESFAFDSWVGQERLLRHECLRRGRSLLRRHRGKPDSWWWETSGLLPNEVRFLGEGEAT